MARRDATRQAVSFRMFLQQLSRVTPMPTSISSDNQGSIAPTNNRYRHHAGSRNHIAIRHHDVREQVALARWLIK